MSDAAASTDVAVRPTVAHPTTGEVVEVVPATPSDVLADVRDRLIEHKGEVDAACRVIDDEIARRLDYEGTRTTEVAGTVGRFKVTVVAPTKTEWDAPALYRALRKLVRAGILSKDRADAACRRETTYKATHGSASQLLRHADERVRDAVEACRSDVEVDRRRVTVVRQRPGAS